MSLLILSGISIALFSQTKISGVINKYGRVTGIGTDYVIVADETQFDQFAAGDTVLLIQMKGARIYTSEDNSFGTPWNSYGPVGAHEFMTVLSIDDATNTIVFRNNIVNSTFNLLGSIQIIKVPSYNFAMVDGPGLSCQPWDSISKTGGVVAAIIGRTLTLNANIDVTGKGFKGGMTTLGLGLCVNSNAARFEKYAFHADSLNSGYKGESIVKNIPSIFPYYAKGRGVTFTGGGGGNGRFSGGGGGASYGAGGKGGREKTDLCPAPVDGGLGGKQIKLTTLAGGLFLGSGGGSSTYLSGSTPTPGGNGGGLVILVCDTLKGNNFSILANGQAVTATASGNAGAGGGGSGGSIALYLQSYSTGPATSALSISANGGKGGDNAPAVNGFGEGGGGGGGLIKTSNVVLPANVTKTINGGIKGQRFGTESADNGQPGESLTDFVPILNGFLFNSIRSSITGTQVDSICSNVIPKPITGTTPVGGSGDYTYLWQKSYNLSGAPADLPSSNVKDFTPAVTESDTVWFRRIVRDNSTALTDTSKWVEIRVQTAIEGNLVGKDTTICYNQDPLSLIPLNSGPSKGNGNYQYQWIQNPNNTDWGTAVNAIGTSVLDSYDPPALTATTYYKRIVTSGRCVDNSAATIITVLPLITGNTISRPDSVICEGSLFNILGASAPGGGNLSYVYQWQDSIPGAAWLPSSGINLNQTYTPDTTEFATMEQKYFRRVVWSGPDSVCSKNSSPILMTRYYYIENNNISKDTTICSGTVPPALTGSVPVKGNGTYTYIWQDSISPGSWATKGTEISPYQPIALTDTTWYRRIVNSSKCSDTSLIVVVNVHKPISDNIVAFQSGPGPDTTICSGAIPNEIQGAQATGGTDLTGDYAYLWYSSTDNFVTDNTAVPVAGTLQDYQPGSLTATTWFRRKAISGKCETFSNSIRIIVLPPITNNSISSGQMVCYNTAPAQLTGPVPDGGDPGLVSYLWEESANGGGSWTSATGTATQQNYSPPALTIPMQYKRTVRSGLNDCCIVVSAPVSIGIHPLPTANMLLVADTTICNGQSVKLKIELTGAPGWNLTYNENSSPVTVSGITPSTPAILRIPDGSQSGVNTFNYSLTALSDGNNCVATPALLTGTRKATVYRVPVANAGSPDEICGPVYQMKAVPSDGTGVWTWNVSVPVLAPLPVAYNDKVIIDSSFTEASRKYKFYWEETNWQCVGKDSVEITFYNRIDPVIAGNDTVIYTTDFLMQLAATPLKPFETGTWSVVEGEGNFDNAGAEATTVRNMSPGINKYKWYVENGKCNLSDIMVASVMNLQIPQGFSPNGDGLNDTYIIRGLDLRKKPDGTPAYQVAELTIINSSGTQIFTTTNKNGEEWKDWDGKNSSGIELPEGTYYYLLKIISLEIVDREPIKESGFIILKRY